MGFMKPYENIILMDYFDTPVPLEDLKRIRENGVETAMHFVCWDRIEKKRGVRDFRTIEEFIHRTRAAGMKAMLMTYITAPTWAPVDWYLCDYNGHAMNNSPWIIFSPWCEEAQAYSDAFLHFCCGTYNAQDVMVINSFNKEGECVLPPGTRSWHDPHAMADFHSRFGDIVPESRTDLTYPWLKAKVLETTVRIQGIYATHPSHSLWLSLHHNFEAYPDAGTYVDDSLEALQKNFPEHELNLIQFTFFEHGRALVERVRYDVSLYGVQVYAGAGWAQGLRETAPLVRGSGIRGLICSPIHPYSGNKKIEEWMLENFRKAHSMMSGK